MSRATLVIDITAYSAQIAVIVAACAPLPRLLRLRQPGILHGFWRTVLAVALALPLVQPWRSSEIGWVSTAVRTVSTGDGAAAGARDGVRLVAGENDAFVVAVLVFLALGMAARLLWVAVGLMRLRTLRTTTAHATAAAYDDLQAAIGTHASIRWCDRLDHPVTFGCRTPVVLLPRRVASLEPAAARALVAHELFHVRRRDWLWLLAEEIVRAVFWFHPAVWWLVSRVQLARETVVDELSILATNARRAYMDTLLVFAGDSPLAPVTAFSRRRHLFYRLMLLSEEGTMSAARVAAVVAVLSIALAGSSVGAARAFPLQQGARDPVPGQLSAAQRAVLDHAVEQARDALAREPNAPDLQHRLAVALFERASKDPALTGADRKPLLQEANRAEDAALAVRPDYVDALVYKNVLLRTLANDTASMSERASLLADADRLRDRALALQGAAPSAESPFATGIDGVAPLKVGGAIKAPIKVKDVRPVYPQDAKDSKVQGVVIAEVLIDGQGKVANARILRSVPMLDEAAMDAIRQWEFTPVLLNGRGVPLVMTVTVNFTLR